jgi:hypothetical protein
MTDLATSNSLTDLAARIRAEHDASAHALKRGLEHAIAAGSLLIEAKKQLAHGQWLPWLRDHCGVPERTAQAYMRVARSFGRLDPAISATVADFSFRDARDSLATTGLIAKKLPAAKFNRALALVEDSENAGTWRRAVRQLKLDDRHKFTLETPQAMLPPPKGRRIRVARNEDKRQWRLAIGPSISRAELIKREEAARETSAIRELRQRHDDLIDEADALEADAKELRKRAVEVRRNITAGIKAAVETAAGRAVTPFTTTHDFQANEETDAKLENLPQGEIVDRLLKARGTITDELSEIHRGYWGDMNLMAYQQIEPAPGNAWTGWGSPEWLAKQFPGWDSEAAPAPDDFPDIPDLLRRGRP